MEENLFKDLEWRGLVSYTSGNVAELLKNPTTFYCGVDPTSIAKENLNKKFPEITSSLHIGHLLAMVTCRRLQLWGHKPIVLVGGFTGLVGDGSFRTEDRKLLSFDEVKNNTACIAKQVQYLVDFTTENENKGILVNNYDWWKDVSLLEFVRGIGKMVSLNYMIAKDSIKSRLEREGCGISLCEALYGPLQGYDFVHLYKEYNCRLAIAGHDQIGNTTYANVLVNKMLGSDHELNILTWPLVTRADGKKFGKSEGGKNIFLDRHLTSPYEFYQFWFNQSDEDAKRFIKLYTFIPRKEIEQLYEEHDKAPHNRILQKRLAKELTIMVHSEEDYNLVIEASKFLFENGDISTLKTFDASIIMAIFNGCPIYEVPKENILKGCKILDFGVTESKAFNSKGELRKLIQSGGLSLNGEKLKSIDYIVTDKDIINDKFITLKQGKKKNILVVLN